MTRTLALLPVLFLTLSTARAQAAPAGPALEDAARARKVLQRLDELERLERSGLTQHERRAHARKLRASLSDGVSRLRGGVLKTELKTSLFFYEQAAGVGPERPAACEDERPGAYRSLCEKVSGDRRQLLLAKARLRAGWASSFVRLLGGDAGDEATRESLREMAAEREFERALAARAVAGLKRIGQSVLVYKSLGDFEEGGALARVPFERFGEELDRVAPDLGRLLAWLPRDDCREEIRKATQSYLDGAWWWSKVQSRAVVRASNAFAEPHPAFAARPVNLSAARYTVAVHWRQARDYTQRAESLLGAM